MSKSTTVKRGRPPVKSNDILLRLKAQSGLTAAELGTNAALMIALVNKGLVTPSGKRVTERRGRPALEFRLTLQGHNRVRSIQAQHAAVAA